MKRFLIVCCVITLILAVSACKKEDETAWKDGEYEGTALGFYDKNVTAKVTISKGKLSAVTIDTSSETPDIGAPVGEKIAASVLEKGSTTGVETIAQATVSSEAALEAVNKALAIAK